MVWVVRSVFIVEKIILFSCYEAFDLKRVSVLYVQYSNSPVLTFVTLRPIRRLVSREYDYIACEAGNRKKKKKKGSMAMSAVHFGANPRCIKSKKAKCWLTQEK